MSEIIEYRAAASQLKKSIMNKKWASNEQVRNKSVTNCEKDVKKA